MVVVRPAGFEPATFGSGEKAPGFHNLLKITKLLKFQELRLGSFRQFLLLLVNFGANFSHKFSHNFGAIPQPEAAIHA